MRKVTGVYFSPTGNTKKSVEAMVKALDGETMVDLTTEQDLARQFEADEWVIFGVPVYGGRIPTAAKGRFANFRGDGTPCIVVATYGNRDFDDALLELADMAREQGFTVRGAAALVGRHTYGDIQTTRPDADDLVADQAFARTAAAKAADAPAVEIPGKRPYKEGGSGGKFRPLTSEACTDCGACARACPTKAIAADNRTISDACIACFRCIRQCPTGAKNIETDEYRSFAAMFTQKLKERRENQYFL